MIAQDVAELLLGSGLAGAAGLAGDPFTARVEAECCGRDPALSCLVPVEAALAATSAGGHDAALRGSSAASCSRRAMYSAIAAAVISRVRPTLTERSRPLRS